MLDFMPGVELDLTQVHISEFPNGLRPPLLGMILHHAEGAYEGAIRWCKNPDAKPGVSAYFVVAYDGRMVQMVPFSKMAWTQGGGNGNLQWIGVEFEGDHDDPLTSQQVQCAARIYAFLVWQYGIPLQITDDVNKPGLGWHGMGAYTGGWNTTHSGCPGMLTVAQRPEILRLARALLVQPVVVPKEDEVTRFVKCTDGDPALWMVSGVHRSWIRNMTSVHGLQTKHFLPEGDPDKVAEPLTRDELQSFALAGPLPKYDINYKGPRTKQ